MKNTHKIKNSNDHVKPKSKIVRPDQKINSVTVFSDEIWNFIENIELPSISDEKKIIYFLNILPDDKNTLRSYEGYILPIKEFCYSRIFDPVKDRVPVKPITVRNDVLVLKSFILWCLSEEIDGLNQVTEENIKEFTNFLVQNNQRESLDRVQKILSTIGVMYRYRDKMSECIQGWPFKNTQINRVIGNSQPIDFIENRTPVIPEKIYEAYLRNAFNYVEYFSKDILVVRRKLNNLAKELKETKEYSESGFKKAFYKSAVNVLNDAIIGMYPNNNYKWRTQWRTYKEFVIDENMLWYACFIIIASLSGMRLSEIFSLEAGCIKDHRTSKDLYGRIYLEGMLYKGRSIPEKVEWVVNDIVKKAVEILEILSEHKRNIKKDNHILLRSKYKIEPLYLDLNGGKSKLEYIHNLSLPSPSSVILKLNFFAEYCIKMFNEKDNLFKDWKFTTSQFRRTLAHYIAKRPFGIIAGMIQYKHVETSIFEGYAGSDPTFLDMLNKERSLASIDFIEEIMMEIDEGEIAGERGAEILENFKGASGDKRNKGIEYYINNKRMNVYPGMFNYCFFDPEVALCLTAGSKRNKQPMLNACRPDVCKNSCITKQHLPAWLSQIEDAKNMLSNKNVSNIQRGILEKSISNMKKVISPLTKMNAKP